jgi:hypothetical protein
MNQDRRRFLGALGVAVLSVECLPAIVLASGDANQGGVADDPVVIHSGPGAFSHVHDLLIPYALLRTPPRAGVVLTSTKALLHRHAITLTQRELMTVGRGGTVIQRASSHTFVIALQPTRR